MKPDHLHKLLTCLFLNAHKNDDDRGEFINYFCCIMFYMNRLLFFCCVFLLCKQNVCAQFISLNDKVKYSIGYEMSYKYEVGKSQFVDNTCVLDVGSHVSHFHSRRNDRAEEIKDSILRNGISPHEYLDLLQKHGCDGPRADFILVRNYPQKGMLFTFMNVCRNFRCEEQIPQMNWQFVKGDTTICGYACKKATINFRGRHWKAWYTLKIPISEGPWKLHGLPGLILCAYEDKGDFKFLCNEIRNGDGKVMRIRNKKAQKCSLSKLIELQRLNIEDYARLSEIVRGYPVYSYDKNGKLITGKGRKACLIEVLPNDKKVKR